MDIFYIIQCAIIIVALSTVYLEIRKMVKLGFHFLTTSVVVVSIFWAVYYFYQLIREAYGLSLPDHRSFVRSGILLTMSVLLAKAIRVNRRLK